MEVSVRSRTALGVQSLVAAIIMLSLGGIAYWQLKPWASEVEMARLAVVRDQLTAFYERYPPMPDWRITAIDVAKPGIVVALEMPPESAALIERRGAKYRLQAAGAICPEPGSPIYDALGRFKLKIHPRADGKPVLVDADCAKVRIPSPHT